MAEFENDPSTRIDDIGYLVRVSAPFVVILGCVAGGTVLLISNVSDRRIEMGMGLYGLALTSAATAIVTSSPRGERSSQRRDVAEARGVVNEVQKLAEDMTEPPNPLVAPLPYLGEPEEYRSPAQPVGTPRAMYVDEEEDSQRIIIPEGYKPQRHKPSPYSLDDNLGEETWSDRP